MQIAHLLLAVALLLAIALAIYLLYRYRIAAARAERAEQISGQILAIAQEGYLHLDPDHRILEANDLACHLLQESREALLNRSIFAFFSHEALTGLGNLGRPETSVEIELTLAGNRRLPCRVNHKAIVDPSGRFAGTILMLDNLAARSQQEVYLQRAAAVFDHAAEGVMILNKEGRLELVNPAFTAITGFTSEEVLGRTPQFFRYGHIWADLLSVGHWRGEIINHRKNGESYPEWLSLSAVHAYDGSVQSYIGLFSDVSHLKKSENELKHMAHYDALTDLPNRTLMSIQLNMALERAARRANKLAIFGVDLDGFKTVNDSLGHPAGDLLLQTIATRLKQSLRSEDVVARLGGDEFAMIIENPPSAIHLSHLAEKIIAAVGRPVDLNGSKAQVTASIGIAIYPQDGEDATTLLKAADTAMYASKQSGKNTYRYHDDEMAKAAHQRMALEQGLRLAMEMGQLELSYQPQVDIRTGDVLGVEALVRWNHPELGAVQPSEFISVAEETGLIVPLGEWVLREACEQVQEWVRQELFMGTVSVNVAGRQIERSDYYGTVKRVLEETGINPKRLVLEIKESILLRNAKQALAELGHLRTLGVSIVIDDFGVGYSSLAYLKYLSAQGIKIDQRFVLGLPGDKNDAAITRAIIAMARSLDFALTAEGVETEAQKDFLEKEGCTQAQGFLYSKPIPAEAFGNWLQGRRRQAGQNRAGGDPLAGERRELEGSDDLADVPPQDSNQPSSGWWH
ncbi:MAG: EAL domain-containing protein [Thiobacillus sp.]|nr:EAL domain-containing protein [Thiobacillus sp.]